MKTFCSILLLLCSLKTSLYSQSSAFLKTVITRDFLSEGVAAADLNKDGQQDIIAGYFWFEAPLWKRHEMAPSRKFEPRKEYSESFLNMALDVNLDGWRTLLSLITRENLGFGLKILKIKRVPGRNISLLIPWEFLTNPLDLSI